MRVFVCDKACRVRRAIIGRNGIGINCARQNADRNSSRIGSAIRILNRITKKVITLKAGRWRILKFTLCIKVKLSNSVQGIKINHIQITGNNSHVIASQLIGSNRNSLIDTGSENIIESGWVIRSQNGYVDLANIGAAISRFDFASANLATSIENLDAARSTLMDVDMASEMSNFSSKQVMMQASVSMLAQANQMPQQLLKLLG